MTLVLAFVLGCTGTPTPPPPATPADAPPPSAPIAPAPPTSSLTPRQLYDGCHDRVESPQKDGECASDADCARTGCGSEVCTSKAAAGDVVTTCEVLPCFSVLDACGCHEGRCEWSLKDAVPTSPTIQSPGDVPQ